MTATSTPEEVPQGAGNHAGDLPVRTALNVPTLLHPSEYSRLLLALSAIVVVFGVIVIWLFVLEPASVLFVFLPVVVTVVVLAVTIWIALQTSRARLLGNCIFVSAGTLPALNAIIDNVRQSLDYRRRVDVYVSEKANEPITMWNYMGTRIILLEGSLIADLQDAEKRPQLVFLLGFMFGTLKARHQQLTLVVSLLETWKNLKFLNLFLLPYFRATTYSGDQIGASCCANVPAVAAMMNRLLVGKELSPSLATKGVLDQAVAVRARFLPRLAQLFMNRPHLTNRYLNLMYFVAQSSPEVTQAYLSSLDEGARERLTSIIENSPHRRSPSRQRQLAQTLGTLTVTAAVLVLAGFLAGQARISADETGLSDTAAAQATDSAATDYGTGSAEPGSATTSAVGATPTAPAVSAPAPAAGSALGALLRHVPASMASTCQAASESNTGLSTGLTAELDCAPGLGAPADVFYLQYGTSHDMNQAFQALDPNAPAGDCTSAPGTDVYSSTPGVNDLYACYSTSDGRQTFAWTNSKLGILSVALDKSMTFAELRTWWEYYGGPY